MRFIHATPRSSLSWLSPLPSDTCRRLAKSECYSVMRSVPTDEVDRRDEGSSVQSPPRRLCELGSSVSVGYVLALLGGGLEHDVLLVFAEQSLQGLLHRGALDRKSVV